MQYKAYDLGRGLLFSKRCIIRYICSFFFFFQAEDGIRDRSPSRGLGDVYKRQVENYECVYNDLLAGRGMFLCPMKYPAFPAAWYLPLQLPLPDTCLLTLRDDPRPEIQRLREVFTAVYASRAKLLGEE